MRLQIRYSERAKLEEIALLEYINEHFGQKKAIEVFEEIEEMLQTIASSPNLFPSSRKIKGLRKCVFSEQTSIYYRVNSSFIEVISFRPNRQDPGKFTP